MQGRKADYIDFLEQAENDGRVHSIYMQPAPSVGSHTIIIAGIPDDVYQRHSQSVAGIPNADLASMLGVVVSQGSFRSKKAHGEND